jgi:hypothetical protein
MKITFRDLWRPAGTIDRGTYVLVGVVGFILKHNLDRVIATYGFHRPWGLFNYWEPLHNAGRVTTLHGDEAKFLATLVATALPFIWVGVMMTLKRLRSAGLSDAFVILFFVPFLNLLFFLVLSLLPERGTSSDAGTSFTGQSWLARLVPESPLGSAALAVLITALIGLGAAVFSTLYLVNYGWGLFVALPFTMGFMAAVMHGIHRPRSLSSCINVAVLSVTLLGVALLGLAFEGIICLAMAIPLAVPLAVFGGVCGYLAQKRGELRSSPALLCIAFVFTPGAQWIEHAIAPPPRTFVVRSAIDINASPEKVWKQVVAFSEIPAPREWIFRAGVAYPIRAEIIGSGAGAERHCVFSTGAFVEPIQVWDEPRLLNFSVTENPPPMQEWTPYAHIDPPHLHGFLVSNGGQFLLTPLPNGGTRLEGTTWYRHGLWPAAYWRVWSDEIIHRIHMRVLTHIRDEAEKN